MHSVETFMRSNDFADVPIVCDDNLATLAHKVIFAFLWDHNCAAFSLSVVNFLECGRTENRTVQKQVWKCDYFQKYMFEMWGGWYKIHKWKLLQRMFRKFVRNLWLPWPPQNLAFWCLWVICWVFEMLRRASVTKKCIATKRELDKPPLWEEAIC